MTDPKPTEKRKSFAIQDLSRIGLVLGIVIGAGWLLNAGFELDDIRSMDDLWKKTGEIRDALHPDGDLREQLISYGWFLIGSAILTAAGLPRWLLCALAGMVYGAFMGTVLSTIGTVAGATIGYLMGQSLLKSMVKRRLGRHGDKWRDRFRRDGFGYTLHLRLFPGSPGLLTNLAAGAFGVTIRDYLLATMLGFLPKTIMVCMAGSGAIKSNYWQLGIALLLYIGFAVGHVVWKRKRRRAESDGLPAH
jgi:uncharacterized membrane protein YdjX (TVP38/TMEM64 family)